MKIAKSPGSLPEVSRKSLGSPLSVVTGLVVFNDVIVKNEKLAMKFLFIPFARASQTRTGNYHMYLPIVPSFTIPKLRLKSIEAEFNLINCNYIGTKQ